MIHSCTLTKHRLHISYLDPGKDARILLSVLSNLLHATILSLYCLHPYHMLTVDYLTSTNFSQLVLLAVSQWPNGNMPDCGVRGHRIESHRGQLFITTATAIYSLGHGLHTLTAVPRSTQPSTIRGTVSSRAE